MAVYVLLSYEDEEWAKRDVSNWLGNVQEWIDNGADKQENFKNLARVIGVWKKPSLFCNFGDGHRGKKTESGWTRGKKYGWWVCGKCGKPTEAWARGAHWAHVLGTNLLPDALVKNPLARLKGWDSPMEWKFLLPKEDISVTDKVDLQE